MLKWFQETPGSWRVYCALACAWPLIGAAGTGHLLGGCWRARFGGASRPVACCVQLSDASVCSALSSAQYCTLYCTATVIFECGLLSICYCQDIALCHYSIF